MIHCKTDTKLLFSSFDACPSVFLCLSEYISAAPNGWIFAKFDIEDLHENLSKKPIVF